MSKLEQIKWKKEQRTQAQVVSTPIYASIPALE
jgi:hypothetical protein